MIPSALLLSSQNPNGFILYGLVGICAGIYIFIRGFLLLRRRKLILNTPASKIRSAPLGLVELNGLAVGPYTVVAPITARPCYFYRTMVWEWKQRGRSRRWVKVATECRHVPFFLDDNSGKVMVNPSGAELDLHRDFHQEFCDGFFTTKKAAPDNVHGFLSRHGVWTTNKIRVEEFCIKPKNALFLLGTLDENPGIELASQPICEDDETIELGNPFSEAIDGLALSLSMGGGGGVDRVPDNPASGEPSAHTIATSRSPEVIRLSPAPDPTEAANMTQQQKIATAMAKAGIANPAAWAAAGVKPSDAAINPAPNGPSDGASNGGSNRGSNLVPHVSPPLRDMGATAPDGFDPRPPVVLMKGKNNPAFLISWRSQRDVAQSLAWKCILMIWGGPAIILLCLYGLHALAHWF
jgi:hypothetical protein